jgi:hypothetical protein
MRKPFLVVVVVVGLISLPSEPVLGREGPALYRIFCGAGDSLVVAKGGSALLSIKPSSAPLREFETQLGKKDIEILESLQIGRPSFRSPCDIQVWNGNETVFLSDSAALTLSNLGNLRLRCIERSLTTSRMLAAKKSFAKGLKELSYGLKCAEGGLSQDPTIIRNCPVDGRRAYVCRLAELLSLKEKISKVA